MGTSTSYRSPPTPRWNAVLAAYRAALSVQRTTSELFNAATVDGWLDHLQGGSLLYYAQQVESLHEALPDRLRVADTAPVGLHNIIHNTRSEALAEFGGDPSLAIGDRAFARLLLQLVHTERPFSDTAASEAANAWIQNRPANVGTLLSHFLSEVLRELILHVTIRDLAGLVGQVFPDPMKARDLSRRLADEAASLVTDDDFIQPLAETPGREAWSLWPVVMDQAFERGRALLGNGRA
jgi:hypothetical protein